MMPVNLKRKKNGIRRNNQDEPEEEEIGLHEWENSGQRILEVPWLRSDTLGT